MSYNEPSTVREVQPGGRIYLVAAATALIILTAVTAIYYFEWSRPAPVREEPKLEGALRAGTPEFEQYRPRVVVEGLQATQSSRALGDIVMELTATVKNTTGRTITGLEMRGAVVDNQAATVGERTTIIIPARQAQLKPDETMNVRVLIEGIKPEADRSGLRLEVTGLRFE